MTFLCGAKALVTLYLSLFSAILAVHHRSASFIEWHFRIWYHPTVLEVDSSLPAILGKSTSWSRFVFFATNFGEKSHYNFLASLDGLPMLIKSNRMINPIPRFHTFHCMRCLRGMVLNGLSLGITCGKCRVRASRFFVFGRTSWLVLPSAKAKKE